MMRVMRPLGLFMAAAGITRKLVDFLFFFQAHFFQTLLSTSTGTAKCFFFYFRSSVIDRVKAFHLIRKQVRNRHRHLSLFHFSLLSLNTLPPNFQLLTT